MKCTNNTRFLSALQPGLLSQAFRPGPPRSFGRAVSLSNLLDQGPDVAGPPSEALIASSSSSNSFTSGSSSAQQQQQQQQQQQPLTPSSAAAAAAAGGGGEEKGRKTRPGQWRMKHVVIELVNELIDELDGIEAQIAQQAVEHIHANEVRGMGIVTCRLVPLF